MGIGKSIAIKMPYHAARRLNKTFSLGITQEEFNIQNSLDKLVKSAGESEENFMKTRDIALDRLGTYEGDLKPQFQDYFTSIQQMRKEVLRDNADYGPTSAQ